MSFEKPVKEKGLSACTLPPLDPQKRLDQRGFPAAAAVRQPDMSLREKIAITLDFFLDNGEWPLYSGAWWEIVGKSGKPN